MRFLRNVSHFTFNVSGTTGDKWEFCNGYAIGKKVRAHDASAEKVQLAYELMSCGRRTDAHFCQRLDDVNKMTPALNRQVMWEKNKSAMFSERHGARG
jgi:hypothetical protein